MSSFDCLLVGENVIASENTILGLCGGDPLVVALERDSSVMGSPQTMMGIWEEVASRQVKPRWRLFVLYPDDTVKYGVPEEDIVSGGSYSETYQTGQRRSLSFSLYNDSGKYSPGVDSLWFDARVRLDMGMELSSGDTVWIRKGVYIVSSIRDSVEAGRRVVEITAGDKWTLFSGSSGTLMDTYEIQPGSDVCSVIRSILLADTESGVPLDINPPRFHHSIYGKKTEASISESAGSTYASLLQDLAVQLSAEMFYDSLGTLVVVPFDETIGDEWKPVLFEYDGDNGDFGNVSFSFNSSEIKNRVVVIGSTNYGNYCRATASNTNPSSPTSVGVIGVRTAPIVNDPNIFSDLLAEERAAYELRKILLLKTKTSLEVAYNPLLTVNNLVAVTMNEPYLLRRKFLLDGVSCSLDQSGNMSISFSNVENLPFLMKDRPFQDIRLNHERGG